MTQVPAFLSAAKLALAIRNMRSDIDASLLASEPVAIVGVGCRFPGGIQSAEDYWRFLQSGGDAIREVPRDRWKAEEYFDEDPFAASKMNSRWGGFLDGADLFDPVFFGISPREAEIMDPQQRLMLEVGWEAIHDSGRAPGDMAGTSTGIFVAIYNTDYSRILLGDEAAIGSHTCAGAAHSMAPGRLSYLLDLHGPSIAIDTACSSSLVGVHLAVQSLRSRDCEIAIAGGVSLKLTPEHYLCLSKLSMLSPDGHCHTFDAAANGFVPGEGCGLVVLKRLSDALAAGDRIRAVIRGSAAGQDGRTASLTAPNGPAQESVIRAAIANARLQPSDIGFVETHGTGTALGDPIEVGALASVIGGGEQPCALGAVKSNFGHLEAAAGIAGLIKAMLVLEKEEIPANLHFSTLNPHIALEGTRLFVPVERTPWKRGARPRFAGVSSFGFTGTNAHIVLEEPPQVPSRRDSGEHTGPCLLAISARTPGSLDAYVQRYVEFLEAAGRDCRPIEVCRNAALRRDHYEERLAVAGESHQELIARLQKVLAGQSESGISRGRAAADPGAIAFVFSGQGSQWARMGAGLLNEPVFAGALQRCDALIRAEAGWSVVDAIGAVEEESLLSRTAYAQPAIFALQVGLWELLRSWGIRPAMVLGHSVGEIAAAHAAGVLDLADAVRVVVHRGKLMDAATGHGRMLSVALPCSTVAADIAGSRSVSVAAINAPASTVISGDPTAVEELARKWADAGVSTRMLPVDYAFHSAQMDPFRTALPAQLGELPVHEPAVTLISTVTGRAASAQDYRADYWGLNVRQPVLFQRAIECALARGARCFVELGPHAVLAASVAECATAEIGVVPTLRRGRDEHLQLASAIGRLYTLGHRVDWKKMLGEPKTSPALPPYPYERRRYWAPVQKAAGPPPTAKPVRLLGEPVKSPAMQAKAWQVALGASHLDVHDHRIAGAVVFPLAGFLEQAVTAWRETSGDQPVAITDVAIDEALLLPESQDGVVVQTVLSGDRFEIYSLDRDIWKRHVSGRLSPSGQAVGEAVAAPSLSRVDVEGYYGSMYESGLEYGPAFRTIRELAAGAGHAVATVEVGADAAEGSSFAPALLDGCLQTVLAASGCAGHLYMPTHIESFRLFGRLGSRVRCHMCVQASGAETISADFELIDESNAIVAAGNGLRLKRVRAMQMAYELKWEEKECTPGGHRPGSWLIVAEDTTRGEALSAMLSKRGSSCALVSASAGFSDLLNGELRGVLYVAAADTGATAYGKALEILQRIISDRQYGQCELWLATRDAQRVIPGDACTGYEQSAVWGLARTAALECPELRCVRIDLDASVDAERALIDELLSGGGDRDLAFRCNRRYVASVARVQATPERRQDRQLVVRSRGSLDSLSYVPVLRRSLADDEVEVEVQASALNFRDVLNALGAYPGDPGPLGIDFCGRVTSIGPRVRNCKAGDLVMGVGWGCFADAYVAKADLLVTVPEGVDPESAATLPNVFATAWHCLVTEGEIRRGDRVLIHAAAGGVGMMAVQIALNAGAEVFATAGNHEKREFLRSMGVHRVFDSRSLEFAAQVLEATGGRGVDLALNSLSGEFIPATLSVMAHSGRFMEIGKTGIWGAEDVAALGKDLRYSVVDLGVFVDYRPEIVAGYLRELCSLVRSGAITPLPKHTFDFDEAPAAFRFMANARHTGKIVLRHGKSEKCFRTSGTWLLTGGLGGMGVEMASYLACRGADALVLAGRRPPEGESLNIIEKLRAGGLRVETASVDIADPQQTRTLIDDIQLRFGGLTGVMHLAGTLDDGVLDGQNWHRFERVYAAKARGAVNLHDALLDTNISHFLLFSSAAAVLGSPGQANYAGANAVLDGLASHRSALGLPALSINWGPWAGSGMAARIEAAGSRRTLSLLHSVSAQDYATALDWAIASGRSNLCLLSADWKQWNAMPGESRVRVTAGDAASVVRKSAQPSLSILDELAALPGSRRRKTAVDHLRALATRILGLSDSYRIDEHDPLMRLGLDSLMALEFRNTLSRSIGSSLPATLLFDCPTVAALADYLIGLSAPEPEPDTHRDALLDEISTLSDEEAEHLLSQELSAGMEN